MIFTAVVVISFLVIIVELWYSVPSEKAIDRHLTKTILQARITMADLKQGRLY